MPLAAGTRLGPFEIVSAIGAGGMGEVYRATDTNLGRQVAIKVLPEAFAHDAERVARFDREAKALGSSCDHRKAQWAVGQVATGQLLEKARVAAGAETARSLRLGQATTLEYRIGRLNLGLDAQDVV